MIFQAHGVIKIEIHRNRNLKYKRKLFVKQKCYVI